MASMTERQREILDALAGQWELLRWRCNDGTHRWHMGEMEVDGRSVHGLLRRGLIEPGGDYVGGQLVLAEAGEG